jgi:hypothetical protein
VKGGTYDLQLTSANVSQAKLGDPITVVVRAPVDGNLKLSGFFVTPGELRVDFACTR